VNIEEDKKLSSYPIQGVESIQGAIEANEAIDIKKTNKLMMPR
jgi:hypothetical protein